MTDPAPAGIKDTLPKLNKDGFDCPRCGHFAHQNWHPVDASETKYIPEVGSRNRWKKAICARCQRPSLWRDNEMIYPLARVGPQPHADMPEPVRDLYDEAAAVSVVSRRAGAALARATVERLVKHLDPDAPTKARLDDRIARLSGRISTPLQQLLDIVRVLGNDMLHVDDEPGELVVLVLDDEQGPEVIELVLRAANDLVDELITRPKTTGTLWSHLSPGTQKAIQQKQEKLGVPVTPSEPYADQPEPSVIAGRGVVTDEDDPSGQ